MNKPTKKRQTYNTEAVKVLADEFGVTPQFVRQCIRKKYYELAGPSERAINDFRTGH